MENEHKTNKLDISRADNEQVDDQEIIDSPISEEEIRQLNPILSKYLKSYIEHKDQMSIPDWLYQEFQSDFPDKSDEELNGYVKEITDTINLNDTNLKSLREAKANGISNEQWFSNTIHKAASHFGLNDTARYLQNIDTAIATANILMKEAVLTKNGYINQNPNLDGFISEIYKTSTFNIDAAIKNEDYRAEVLNPEGGVYNKNSVDIQIKDENGKVVGRYQDKMGKDTKATEIYFKKGDYRGQKKIVPSDQVDQIEGAVDKVSYDGVEGKGLTKEEAKTLQEKVQSAGSDAIKTDWTELEIRELSLGIGKQAVFSGITSAGFAATFEIASSVIKGESIDGGEVIEKALKTGSDTGIKAAVTGAVKVASEKGILKLIPKGTPASTIANIVFVSIENLKIMMQILNGEISLKDGFEKMCETTTSIICGIVVGGFGSGIGIVIGALVGTLLGPIGTAIGAGIGWVLGGMTGYSLGACIGNAIGKVAVAVANTAINVVKSVVIRGASIVKNVCEGVRNIVSNAVDRIFG